MPMNAFAGVLKKSARHAVLSAPIAVAGLMAVSAPATAESVLKIVPHADLRNVDPIWTTAYITRNHGYLVFDTLFALDENLEVQPQMAAGHDVSEDGLTIEQIDEMAKTPELDEHIRPLEEGLDDLPQVSCTDAGLARLRNGNPGMVIAHDVEYGEECWASYDGKAVAVGRFKAGELHPSRVFNQ